MKRDNFFFVASIGISAAVFLGGNAFLAVSAAVNVPTQVTTTSAVLTLTQSFYRWYANIDALTPSSPFTAENTATGTPATGTVLRLRMNLADGGVDLGTGATFNLQYANSSSGPWTNLSTSTAWIFFDNLSVADGQIIVTTVLSNSDVGESYDESNPSAATPNAILQNQRGEWDWVIENNSADTADNWFFRMIYSSSTALDSYANYPKLSAVAAPPPPPSGGGGGTIGVGGGQIFPPPPTHGQPTTTPPLPIPPPLLPLPVQIADFDGDNRVDIVDLSILLSHYHQKGPGVTRYDLNRDGTVDFPDVSILMFYWIS